MTHEKNSQHIPVMLSEVLEYLNPQPGGIFVDGTLGLGGHGQAFLERLGPSGRLIGIDKDGRSLKVARQNLKAFEQQCSFVQDDYRNIPEILKAFSIERVDGIFLDLGISSFQID
jgi:16S rRNA (cytosine1402-N4)-methyltransferase